jgi:hypothetical protein
MITIAIGIIGTITIGVIGIITIETTGTIEINEFFIYSGSEKNQNKYPVFWRWTVRVDRTGILARGTLTSYPVFPHQLFQVLPARVVSAVVGPSGIVPGIVAAWRPLEIAALPEIAT